MCMRKTAVGGGSDRKIHDLNLEVANALQGNNNTLRGDLHVQQAISVLMQTL